MKIKKQTTIFEIFHIFLPILLPSLKQSRGFFEKTTFFYSCQLIFLPCSVPIIWMIVLIWFVLVTGYWLVVVSLSSPWQQVGGWERREERGESEGTKPGEAEEERDLLRTERENAGEFCEQDNRHSEWYHGILLY